MFIDFKINVSVTYDDYAFSLISVPRIFTLDQIEQAAIELLDIVKFPEGLRTRSRKRDLVLLRQCVYKISRNQSYGLDMIGDYYGYDHATVIHGVRVIDNLIDSKNIDVINTMNMLENQLKEKYGKVKNEDEKVE